MDKEWGINLKITIQEDMIVSEINKETKVFQLKKLPEEREVHFYTVVVGLVFRTFGKTNGNVIN